MKIAGEHTYPHPRDAVWQALLDPEVLSRTLPGCEDLKQTGENEYAGRLKMKVGPVQGVFAGEVQISNLSAPDSYDLSLNGKGAPGFVKGEGHIELEDAPDGGTLLRYEIDAQVGGRIAAVGQRLVDSSAKVITRQGLEGLGRQLDARAPSTEGAEGEGQAGAEAEPASNEGTTTEATTATEGPTQTDLAREVAKGVFADLVPPAARRALLVAGILLAIAIVAVVLRGCGGP